MPIEKDKVVSFHHPNADLDTNHPLAGKSLTCDLEIQAVRDASAEELVHGHARGAGGHQHCYHS